jgi:tetratricopeptide (TPR) repeat protein
VSYYQAGRICDYINDKWGWDTLLAMLHDFGQGMQTADVIQKELKIDAAEFDKQFLATVEGENKSRIDHFDEWKRTLKLVADAAKTKDYSTVIKLGTQIRDMYPDYVEAGSVYEFLADAYINKGDKANAIAELERYLKIGGRDPGSIKLLAKELEGAGRKKDAAAALERLNYIYPMDDELHQRLGKLWLELDNGPGAVREFTALVAHKPLDPAQAHYDLARAYRLNHQPQQAQEEVLAALEAAPGFRPAQKLLLELSGEEGGTTRPPTKK